MTMWRPVTIQYGSCCLYINTSRTGSSFAPWQCKMETRSMAQTYSRSYTSLLTLWNWGVTWVINLRVSFAYKPPRRDPQRSPCHSSGPVSFDHVR
eukprot:gene6804-biopygen13855